MKTKFAPPELRDLRFERVQPEILKRANFALDEAGFAASIADGFVVIACLLVVVTLFGLFS